MISVVIPCFQEEEALPALVVRLRPVLDGLDEPYEVVFVDDGSQDGTWRVLGELAAHWPEVRCLRLGRNSGHQAALTAGLDVADGHWVVTMDADLQDPPELIPEMVRVARENAVEVVYARRKDRSSDPRFKRGTANLYYSLMRRLAEVEVPRHVGDFRLLSRRVVMALRHLPDHNRVYRLLIPWLGYPSAVVEHVRDPRVAGVTKYSVKKMTVLAVTSLTTFSTSPLRIATATGLAIGAVSVAMSVWALAAYVLGGTVPGWASTVIPVYFLGAVQLSCIGVLGEYLGRVFQQVQGRPAYHVVADSASSEACQPAQLPETNSA
ncbi:MAG TPA: glycosyltransferase family 2 protein [Geodermatophilus sp.]|nr:glycosyltransferase family 2 protein [Geodermatophilus sp.]